MFDTYRTDSSVESKVTTIDTGDGRHFVVVQYRIREWKTLVLQHEMKPDCWISRREVDGKMDPALALTGYLLGPKPIPHPIEDLKRRLAARENDNWTLRKRLMDLERAALKAPAGKRGGRGR
jgi:hypothetical protein